MAQRIRKEDIVQVISGKYKGQTGKVLKVLPKKSMAIVEKVGVVKRHQKAKPSGGPSGIVEKTLPMDLCKLMVFDEKARKPSRIKFVLNGDKKERVAKRSGTALTAAK